MIIISDVLITFLLFFGLFGILHTLLASEKIKKRIIEKAGTKIAFYWLFFNLISMLIFITIYLEYRKNVPIIIPFIKGFKNYEK